jgi:hypothetical protein
MIKQHPRKLRAKNRRQRQYESAALVQTLIGIDALELGVIPICVSIFRAARAILRVHAVAIIAIDQGTPRHQ